MPTILTGIACAHRACSTAASAGMSTAALRPGSANIAYHTNLWGKFEAQKFEAQKERERGRRRHGVARGGGA